MKQKDIGLIIVSVIVSGVLSILISGKLISAPKNRQEKVEVVEPIVSDFKKPDPTTDKYFNSKAIDPTQTIKIGDNNNDQPFNKQ